MSLKRYILITIAIFFLTSPCITLLAEEDDSDEKRTTVLNKYFTEGVENLTQEKATDLMMEYYFGNLENLKKTIEKAESMIDITDDEHEIFASFIMVQAYANSTDLSTQARGDFEKLLVADTIMNYAKENVDTVLKKLLEMEMSRQGITDEVQREETLKQLTEAAEEAKGYAEEDGKEEADQAEETGDDNSDL